MEMHQIRYFLAVCETLNFTRAAEACNVAQPSLTRAIQKLEDELGGPLFRRERNLTHLTDLGRLMRPHLEQTLAAARAARQQAEAFAKLETAPLAIALEHGLRLDGLEQVVGALCRKIGGLNLRLRRMDRDAMVEALMQGELDIAFAEAPEGGPERLDAWPLFEEPQWIVGRDPAGSAGEGGGLAALHERPWIARPQSGAERRLQALLAGGEIQVQVRHEVSTPDDALAMARAGVGWTLVPEGLMTDGLARLDPGEVHLHRPLVMLSVSGRRHAPALAAFINLIKVRRWGVSEAPEGAEQARDAAAVSA